MSTSDVPGARPENGDQLAMGCWAEHKDGSMIFVESTEDDRVVYSIFDRSKRPIVEYRDAMETDEFKEYFSWTAGDGKKKSKKGKTPVEWTWHDKTPFDWSKIVQRGAQPGVRYASADDQLTAAERVAESLKLHGRDMGRRYDGMEPEVRATVRSVWGKISDAVDRMLKE